MMSHPNWKWDYLTMHLTSLQRGEDLEEGESCFLLTLMNNNLKNTCYFNLSLFLHLPIPLNQQLFVQLNELDRDDMGGQQSVILSKGASWKSRARWIKFEENWEEGADRWSKPHVASLTFNSLPQLRRGLENGESLVSK